MPALPHNTAVYLPLAGEYLIAAELTSGQTVALDKRTGDSGAWRPVTIGETEVTLTFSDPTARVAVAPGEFLRATCSPTTVAVTAGEVQLA